jgi:hypothetical protein
MESIACFFRDLGFGKDSRRGACNAVSTEKPDSPGFSSGDAVEDLEPEAANKRSLDKEGAFEDYGLCR